MSKLSLTMGAILLRGSIFHVVAVTGVFVCASLGAAQGLEKRERAKLPDAAELSTNVFFKDAFAEGLVGERPDSLGAKRATDLSGVPNAGVATKIFKWSSVITSQTLEGEVKKLQIELKKIITTPSKFSGGGYLEVRRRFTELATLFSVIKQYDADVRWKKEAGTARDLFVRAAANTKTTSIQAFNESRKRRQDLEELVRGGTLATTGDVAEHSWDLINRASLMQRFTVAYDDGIAIWTANEDAFRKQASNIRREAELLMMMGVVLKQDGMEDGDDEDYAAYADQLMEASRKVVYALDDNDPQAARTAASLVGQSCIACHEDYRG